jgi:radical SAM superfamily enzyme YgiQ (UPF0313 family)
VRNIEAAEPLGLMQLSALLKNAGHEARIAGARNTRLDMLMDSYKPQLVGYSATTGMHRYLIDLNRALKKRRDFISIFGGPHPTFFPEMVEEDGVDAVCRGEGEGAILDIARAIDTGGRLDNIQNLWVKSPSGIMRNSLRPLVADLDALPFADRESRYEADPESREYPVKSFSASRGCPYRCAYCFNSGYAALYGPEWSRVRNRSPENLIAEINEVRRTSNLKFVQFRESIFPWDDDWLEEFSAIYKREVGLPFYCHVRADLVTAERMMLLKSAGCVSVNMGIECGDEKYRREVLCRSMSDETIIEACRIIKSAGLKILADNMLGLPGAGIETDWKTLELNRRCGVDYPLAMIYQPYPGSALGAYAVEKGFFDGDFEKIEYNYYLRSPMAFRNAKEKNETENLQKFFAILTEAPWLEPAIRPWLKKRPNLVWLSMFRAWFAYSYLFRIIPHRMSRKEKLEVIKNLFGIFKSEAKNEVPEKNRVDVRASRNARGRASRGAIHQGVHLHQGCQSAPKSAGN